MTSFLFLGIFVLSATLVNGLNLVVSDTRLPARLYHLSAVYDGQDAIYLVGGDAALPDSYNDKVWKFSTETGLIDEIGTFRETSRGITLLDNPDLLYFGAYKGSYDPFIYRVSTNATGDGPPGGVVVGAYPDDLSRTRIVRDPTSRVAYMFGGWLNGGRQTTDRIYEYDPNTGAVNLLPISLPEPKYEMGVTWNAREGLAYLFGGAERNGVNGRQIVTFSPSTGNVTNMGSRLAASYTVPLCAGFLDANEQVAYIVAAQGMQRYNTATSQGEVLEVEGWPASLSSFGCTIVPKQKRLYIFGGYGFYESGLGRFHDEIAYVDL